jgi:quercetin dioxygenase-like cupin family protein
MTQTQAHPTIRPYALGRDGGEHIWFTNASFAFKATAASTGGELFLVEALLPAGFSPPLHVHHDEHEAFYVLEGTLEIVCGDERYEAAPGSFAFLPSGIAHSFRVSDDAEARVLALAVPGGIEEFFREVGRPAEGPGLPPQAPVDVAQLTEAAARFNNQIIGPPLGPRA